MDPGTIPDSLQQIAVASQPATESAINNLITYFNSAAAFTAREVPIFAQELIRWAIYQNLMEIVQETLIFGLLIFTLNQIINTLNKIIPVRTGYEGDRAACLIAWRLAPKFFVLLNIAFVASDLMDIIKALVAPRLFLVQELMAMLPHGGR